MFNRQWKYFSSHFLKKVTKTKEKSDMTIDNGMVIKQGHEIVVSCLVSVGDHLGSLVFPVPSVKAGESLLKELGCCKIRSSNSYCKRALS